MRELSRKLKIYGMILFLMLSTAGAVNIITETTVQAAVTTGLKKINGKTYYIKADGSKHKGWLTLKGKKYYFNSKGEMYTGWKTISGKKYYFGTTGQAAVGWRQDKQGNRRYFTASGVMATQWMTIGKDKYYFMPDTGIMKKGWLTWKGQKFYLNSSTGVAARSVLLTDKKRNITRYFTSSGRMVTGFQSFGKGKTRYFHPSNGAMAIGFTKVDGKTYFFYSKTGYRITGWLKMKTSGKRYYFDPKTAVMKVNETVEISGYRYSFNKNGELIDSAKITPTPKPTSTPTPTPTPNPDYTIGDVPDTDNSTGSKTIKNYLAGALKPVGQALYVWGGGWTDATRKGVSPTWKEWYDSQSSSYDYNYYRDLSAANRAKGLDCSGFVGWSAYQVMQKSSGVGSGYTVVSGEIGSYYKSLGWGNIVTQANLSASDWVLKPGDVGYNSGHTWIVIGQCSDKSVVIVHSTPQAGCQIAGTCTPTGGYESEAIQLARKYMSKYYGFNKYNYHTSSGNYIRNGNYLRWNRNTLSDPEGYLNKTADQILYDLFGF